jgi:hypothetical protein
MENKTYDENNQSLVMMLGDYLDLRVTMDTTDLENLYVIADSKRPSENVQTLLDQFLWTLNQKGIPVDPNLSNHSEYLGKFLDNKDWYPNSSEEGKAKNLISKGAEWWSFLIESKDKIVMSSSEKSKLDAVYTQIFDRFLSKIQFKNGWYQKELYWKIGNTDCKGLLDILIEEEHEMIEIDLKYTTCKTLEDWFYVVKKLNYPFQKAWYKEGIMQNFPKKDIRQYWLVASEHFIHMVPVISVMQAMGQFGYWNVKGMTFFHGPDHKDPWRYEEATFIKERNYGWEEALKHFLAKTKPSDRKFLLEDSETEDLFLC